MASRISLPLRARVHRIFEAGDQSHPLGRAFDFAMIALILTNVVAVTLESIPSLAEKYYDLFYWFDVFSITIFTVEYIVRVWVSTEDPDHYAHGPIHGRIRYMLSPMALIDLIAILPFYMGFFLELDLRFLRVFRLLRLLKLTRYSPALQTVGVVLGQQWHQLMASLVIMLTLLVFSASVAYLFEHKAQPEHFDSIPSAMWWAIATLTTVGYGDVTPVTIGGKIFGAFVMILGIGMYALPTGILALGFAQEFRRREFTVTWRLVASVPLFSQLNAVEIADIARILHPRRVPPRYVIVRLGEDADAMYLIVSGEVEVELHPTPLILGPGDFFGEIALMQKTKRTATVTAITECQLLVLGAKDLEGLETTYPQLHRDIHSKSKERVEQLKRAKNVV